MTSTKQFVWCPGEPQPCEERDGSDSVTKRFYAQGEQIGSTNYYYTRDHLGSIREVTDNSGAVQARYDYDCMAPRKSAVAWMRTSVSPDITTISRADCIWSYIASMMQISGGGLAAIRLVKLEELTSMRMWATIP